MAFASLSKNSNRSGTGKAIQIALDHSNNPFLYVKVLLLRPQNEKEASVISIWHRLVNTLIENVLNNPQMATDSDAEGLVTS